MLAIRTGFRDDVRMILPGRNSLQAGRLSEANLLAAIVDSSDDAIISKSLDSIVLSWNAAAERLFGYTADEAVGRHISFLIPADRLSEEELIIGRLRAGERVDHFDTIRLRKDGRPVEVSLTISPIKDAEGRVVGASKIARDISDRKRTEARLRFADERVRLALDSAELGAWHIDLITNALTSDERFRLIFHGSTEPITYEQAFAAIHPDDRQRIRDSVAAATRPDDPTPYAEDYRVVHPDGSIRWVFGKGRANFEVRETGLRLASFDGTVADITERRQMENDLRTFAATLSDVDRRKTEFLATLAHELRNPLAPLRNAVQIMKLSRETDTLDRSLSLMERQLDQMVRLVDDLMDVSRIGRGQIELRRSRVELASVVQSAIESTRPLIEKMEHSLVVTLPKRSVIVEADFTRLAQAFVNLLNNAAKYSNRGGRIELSISRKDNHASVSVKDSGIGIAADQLPRVFEMFLQVDSSLERSQGGLGIGLTLVKRLVEMHGGTISAMSEGLGKGSEFIVELPLASDASELKKEVPEDRKMSASLRILNVDDNRDGAESLAVLLNFMGNETRTAFDGEEAVRVANDFRPNVVLLDIGLPKLNGFEACRRIRESSWAKNTTLIAVTGLGQEDDRRRSKEAGFNHHMVKPVDPNELMKLLADLPVEKRSLPS
jgi:PAS domain S-box-containing protein